MKTMTRLGGEGGRLAGLLGLAALVGAVVAIGPGHLMTRPAEAAPAAMDGGTQQGIPGLRDFDVVDLAIADNPLGGITVSLPHDGEQLDLDLMQHSVRAPDFQLLAQVADGSLVEVDPGPVNTYRGAVRDQGGQVSGGFVADQFYAKVDLPGRDTFWVEPLDRYLDDANENQYLVYRSDDVLPHGGVCGVTTERPLLGDSQPLGTIDGNECTELACDADFEYYIDWGSNVNTVMNRINLVINTVNQQYEDDVDITHIITAIIVRTSEPDPYTSTDAGTLLNQFRNEWLNNQGGIQRDVAHLFTGKSINGGTIGIAFDIGAICTNNAYCLAESDFSNFFDCTTDLTAHELGHLWNGFHCNCPSHTMNPSITCANQFNPTQTVPDIVAHRNSRTCLDCPIIGPPNNDCADAGPIPPGATPFTTIGADTDGPFEPDCNSGTINIYDDVWFNTAAPCTGVMTFSTCGADFNSKIAVYPIGACPPPMGGFLGCEDSGCGDDATVQILVTQGDILKVRVGAATPDDQGEGTLVISCEAQSVCPCDLDNDGDVDVDDMLTVLGNWGAGAGGDCTDDGQTNVDDLLAVLGGWGACP